MAAAEPAEGLPSLPQLPITASNQSGTSLPGQPASSAAQEFAQAVLDQVLRYALQPQEISNCIRRWLVTGESSTASVIHHRVLKQRGGGRCGYHALFNAATVHAAASRRPQQHAADLPLLDLEGSNSLHDPVSVYSFIGFVERVLGWETLFHKVRPVRIGVARLPHVFCRRSVAFPCAGEWRLFLEF